VIRRRAFRGFFRKGFPRKNLYSCSLFDLLFLRYFITSGIRAKGFRIRCPGDFSLPSRAASRSIVFVDQHLQSCGISFVEIKATGGS
jgi:hypothetical protein